MNNIVALLLTIMLEIITITCFYRLIGQKGLLIFTLTSIVLNILTNVPLNFIIKPLDTLEPWLYILIVIGLEIVIIGLEFLGYFLITKKVKQSFIISLIANIISFVIGSAILNLLMNML